MKFSTTLRLLMVAPVAALAFGNAMAEESKLDPKKPVKQSAKATMEKGKADIKVTGDETKNSTGPAVEKRAGPISCDVQIDNRTNKYINRVYIDGRNWGSVGRYGDALARDVVMGPTTLYAEVDYSDGSTGHYGPKAFNCNSYETSRWVLN